MASDHYFENLIIVTITKNQLVTQNILRKIPTRKKRDSIKFRFIFNNVFK